MAITHVSSVSPWVFAAPNTVGTSAAFTPTIGNQLIVLGVTGAPNSMGCTGTSTPFNLVSPPGNFLDAYGDLDCLFTCPSVAAGSQSVVLTVSAASYILGWAYEYSGIATFSSGASNNIATGATGSGAIQGTSTFVPTGSKLIAFCLDGQGLGGTITSPTGTNVDAGTDFCVTEYTGANANITPTFTGSLAATDDYFIMQVRLDPPAGAPPPGSIIT